MGHTSRKAVILTAIAALGIGLSAATTSTAAQAAPATGPASAGRVLPDGGGGGLAAVSADSPTDAWAVAGGSPGTVTLHWDGTAWSQVPSPSAGPKGDQLTGVTAESPADAWAVGYYANSTCAMAVTLILHWNGIAWSRVRSPDPGAACNYLEGVSVTSATDAWAVGQSCTFAVNTCHTLILHWNGTAWSKVASPSPGTGGFDPLTAVSADSAADAWAVGYYCTTDSCTIRHTLTLHWNGTAWSRIASPNQAPGTYFPDAVSADSPTDAWTVGTYCTAATCDSENTLTLHWNGTVWSKVASPNPGPVKDNLNGVTALSPTDAWAVGDYCVHSGCSFRDTLTLHWDGTAWSQVASPTPRSGPQNYLSGVTATGTDDAWAVGSTILHWNGAAWSISPS